jgi:hypothetical protein
LILRELLAVFGLQFDDKGMRKAEGGLKKLQDQATKLTNIFSTILTAGAAISPFVLISKLASDATETMNLLGVTFQENTDEVMAWADETADAMGRSRFELREFAGNLGLVFRGMGSTTEAAAKMSTELSAMAVDFSSLSNFAEADVLGKIRSGLTGETEGLKQLGIVMTETMLAQFALEEGITKSVKSMKTSEKVALRYRFLMDKMALATGDAAKTGQQFAGAVRRTRSLLLDLGTTAGLQFLPVAEKIVNTVADLLVGFRELTKDTNILKGAMFALGLVAAAVLVPMLVSLAPLLIAFALFAIIIGDVITTFEGGNSILGEFNKLLEEAKTDTFDDMNPTLRGLLVLIKELTDALGVAFALIASGLQGLITGDMKQFNEQWDLMTQDISDAWGESTGHILQDWEDLFKSVFATLKGFADRATMAIRDIFTTAIKFWRRQLDDFDKWLRSLPGFGLLQGAGGAVMEQLEQGLGFGGGGSASLPPGAAGMTRNVVVNQGDTRLRIDVQQQPGQGSEEIVGSIEQKVRSILEERDEQMLDDLVQQAS